MSLHCLSIANICYTATSQASASHWETFKCLHVSVLPKGTLLTLHQRKGRIIGGGVLINQEVLVHMTQSLLFSPSPMSCQTEDH